MKEVTMRQVGGSIGTTLPKDMLDHFHIKAGDTMYAVQTERGILLTPYDPTFKEAVEAYERFSRRYRNALKELAEGA